MIVTIVRSAGKTSRVPLCPSCYQRDAVPLMADRSDVPDAHTAMGRLIPLDDQPPG
jgi:hypothetical protein